MKILASIPANLAMRCKCFAAFFLMLTGVLGAQTPFAPSAPVAGVEFGFVVDADAIRFVVSSAATDQMQGKTYLFEKNTGGISHLATFTQTDGYVTDGFGHSVSVLGDRLAIGADQHNATGAVYTYKRQNNTWIFAQKLILPDAASGDLFGTVKLWENYLFVGARGKDNPHPDSGVIYVYQHNGSQWNKVQELTAPNGQNFGTRIEVQNGRLLSFSTENGGHLFHSFLLQDGNWAWEATSLAVSAQAGAENFEWDGNGLHFIERVIPGTHIIKRLTPGPAGFTAQTLFNFASFDQIYDRLVVAGNQMFIGSGGYSSSLERKFPVLVYSQGDGWNYQQTLYSQGAESVDDYFGWAMALSGNNLIIGAPFENGGKAYFVDTNALEIQTYQAKTVQIYPNPARDVLHLELEQEPESVEVYSVAGVLCGVFYKKSLDVSPLAAGVYFLKIRMADQLHTVRFVKQ